MATANPPLAASAADFLPLDDSDADVSDASSSDVPMTVETDEEDNADHTAPHQPTQLNQAAAASNNTVELRLDLTRKRKSSDDASDKDSGGQGALDSVKKVKLADLGSKEKHQGDGNSLSDASRLPGEVWQHLFTFCPPRTLGRLLQVNRLFNVYLDPSSTIQCERPDPLPKSAVPVLQPNSIWQASRRRFWPGMAGPLQNKTELYMWQLSCSGPCQHCGSIMPQQKDWSDLWQSGPGKDGIAIIWPFATRSCGACLLRNSTKVCCAKPNQSSCVLVLTQCQEIDILLSPSIPSALTMALPVVFVTKELQAVSPATVEKDLPQNNGQLTKLYWSADVEELTREFSNVKAMGTATTEEWLKGLEGRGIGRRNDASKWENWAIVNGGLRQMRSVLYPGYQATAVANNGGTMAASSTVLSSFVNRIPGISNTQHKSPTAAPSVASSQHNDLAQDQFRCSSSGTVSHHSGRHERTKEEAAELKAARKAEIERRALTLDPPLPAHVLAHIPAFQAALQITTPMDDKAWEILKPRLIPQRADAEQKVQDTTVRVQQDLDEKRNSIAVTTDARDSRDTEDADWDEAQAPVRARIAGYADEIIRNGWEEGDKIGRDNCAKFAVEALVYIRRRFYAEVAKDTAAALALGKPAIVDPPQGPFTQKLTLENMKWIFDMKIKPLTERYRKEIFFCNGCDVTVRAYGFEGVIQHYAAKHTRAMSLGTVVVHWRAEWPEHPPFTSEQRLARTYYQNHATATHNTQQPGLPQPFQPLVVDPAPGYTPYTAAGGGYAPQQGYGATPYAPTDVYQSHVPAAAQQTGYIGPAHPPGAPYQYNYGAFHNNPQAGYPSVQPSSFSAPYSTHVEDMAHLARDLWNSTANLKDTLNMKDTTDMKDTLSIVRVQVVVYHVAKRFHAKFGIPLPLQTFIDGLTNHKDMKPVRNVNWFFCRVCHLGIGGYVPSEDDRKSMTLPRLAAHFQTKHITPFTQMGQYGQPPEWTVDMVLLPDPAAVPNLRAVIGMDGQKYQLVKEAVPHLLEAPSIPAPSQAPREWHDEMSHHQNYQGVAPETPAESYGQVSTDNAAQNRATGQYAASGFGSAPQYPSDQMQGFNHAEPLVLDMKPMPQIGALTAPKPVPAAHTGGAESSRSDSGNRSGQGNRARRQKSKKKGSNRDFIDEEARKRTIEEEKMAEEEAEREADVIRAMWAADRATAASKTAFPDGQQAGNQGKTNKPNNAPKAIPKPDTPKPSRRFQSRPPRNPSRGFEEVSPPGGGDLRIDTVAHAHHDVEYRGFQLSNVAFADGDRDEAQPQDWQRSLNTRDRYEPSTSNIGRPRSRSPAYERHIRSIPPAQFRQRSPFRQQHDQPIYQPRPPAPADDVRYEREPVSRNEYGNYGPPGPAPRLIEYEIIEYRNPDGTITIEERPLRRIPNSEAGRYYRDVQTPTAPAPYDRGEPLPPPPASYRRSDQPLPPTAGDAYYTPYDRAYSRAPLPPPPRPGSSDAYDPRYPSGPPTQRNEQPLAPPQRMEPIYYEDEEYDPRFPNGPPNAPVPPSRPSYH